ncbi:hypothetical protein NDI85_08625 [Halomicroarcula sp. S1AR25-4]|uniref:hypothetical protein n=1 Tax=Haloarcula sp. S1AR25-4 TaxID=2950538 RepID=UPI002876280B|nr:hypothetical protein [Halomicroarcula sp. S1AR25-4]MDS0277858.1 hypothetical protein [Halomicroarcula sp. S1AR25-4]
MVTPPAPGRWDAAAAASVAALLVVAYVLIPDATVQYSAWLLVFCIWMAWFVAFGARWLYGE